MDQGWLDSILSQRQGLLGEGDSTNRGGLPIAEARVSLFSEISLGMKHELRE